jgi:hypothetical protein
MPDQFKVRGDSPTAMNKTRALEWLLACLMIMWGATLLGPENFFDLPAYKVMSAVMRETTWGMLAVCFGTLRCLGLAINGWWRRTPIIRFVGSVFGGLGWLSIGFLMYAGSVVADARLQAGMGYYVLFFVFEGWCTLATGYDMHKNGSLSTGALPRNAR